MNAIPIMSVGITPYGRITPSFFLSNYSIYTINRSSDVENIEPFFNIYVLEDFFPKIAERIHGTGYLVGNHAFQNFIKTRRTLPKLQFQTISEKAIGDLDKLGISWIGNAPATFEEVAYKSSFRDLIKKLGLPSIVSKTVTREGFLASSFEKEWAEYGGAFVVQRGDKEVGGNEGTFFIKSSEDFERCISSLAKDEGFKKLVLTPFIEGHSTSMLGCVLPQGTLTGPLQLQLIDVPQSLQDVPASGIFFGNDLGFKDWGDDIEKTAQTIVEGVGKYLGGKGYRGVFGIDFLYDKARNEIYANECNPRFTGSLLLHSLSLLESRVPPLEFFHLLSHLGIESAFDFDTVNKELKTRNEYSHISFSPRGIMKMGLPLLAGIYSYDEANSNLEYVGPGISLADIKDKNQFLIIDTVPKQGKSVEQNIPRLFKFIFPYSIAKSSHEIESRAALLVDRFAKSLIKASQE